MKKYKIELTIAIVLLFIILGISPAVSSIADSTEVESDIIEFTQVFSEPRLIDDEEFIDVNVKEAKSYKNTDGAPMIPVFSKTYEFSFGTKISDITYEISTINYLDLEKQIRPVPTRQKIGNKIENIEGKKDENIYSSYESYPSDWLSFETGVGINEDNNHVLYLTLYIYPIQYIPGKNIVYYIDKISTIIKYEEIEYNKINTPTNDLVIITPSEFLVNLEPLVFHKISNGIETHIETLENIYGNFSGRDKAEKIKYYIKYALEEWGSNYVLLIGDIKKLPIRSTHASPWGGGVLLTDLYYSDIYNDTFGFCSWDGNNNDIFGEIVYDGGHPFDMIDIDDVDLFADTHIGRIPCSNAEELDVVVNKIIDYEQQTYGQSWFNKIVLAGGDTFPPCKWGTPFIYEGEITNSVVAEQVPEFDHVKLWTSKYNLNALTFNFAITQGAGFVSYAGHGFEMGWGTYPPNALVNRLIMYYSPYLIGMKNNNKLPIFFFDACLTAKLDFNISDVNNYYPLLTKFLLKFTDIENDPSIFYPSFAWAVLKKENGGAIASVGATRTAYTWVNDGGVFGGAGLLDVQFFKAYEEGVTAGEMLTQAQNGYMNNAGKDYFTIEEYILLGDPSLKVGGIN